MPSVVCRLLPTLATLTTSLLAAGPAPSILKERCQSCHGATAKMGGLSLASAQDALKGGAHGPAIIPGNPERSLLVQMVSGEKPRMPMQSAPLTKEQVASIRKWIAEGAPWLDESKGTTQRQWWSLAPLRKPAVPAQRSPWVRTPVDAFILEKLAEQKLAPTKEADRATLIRRLAFDLHGLPPSWDEIRNFTADRSPDAYERLVDRMLSSPRYGERWGRHWLDVVHYGESHGYDKDKPRRNAWPYRDYVIAALNNDKPYKRFVEEQVAGDVLYQDDPQALVATGFVAAGPWDLVGHAELREGTTDKNITRVLDRDDMVMATMSTFVSMTAHCARCHDHKFDPIKQEDYYSLQAVFAGVDRADRPYDLDPALYAKRRVLWERRRTIASELRPWQDAAAAVTSPELEKLNAELSELKFDFAETKKADLQPGITRLTAERKRMMDALVDGKPTSEIARLTGELRALDIEIGRLPKPQWVYAAANYFDTQGTFRFAVEPRPVTVLERGSVESPGAIVRPGALSCVPGLPARFNVSASGEGERRAALARWITAPENVLTWRSIVNRVWQYHFGAGIVDSPNDFGRMGSKPSHPELLDWLAVTFRDSGGSLKHLHKLILVSSTYRQASSGNAAGEQADADNRLLWRQNRQRLDAESVRDATLMVSGKLDLTMGGPSAEQFWFKDDHSPTYDYARFDPESAAGRRRSVYRFIVRSAPDPFMDRLDCPDASLSTPKRGTTITAIQALALLNNPFMVRQSEHLAERLRALSGERMRQIEWMYRLTLGRDATRAEADRMAQYVERNGLENACRVILNSNEFMFVD